MYEYNDELRAAAEQVARQKHLKTVQSELLRQKKELSRRVEGSKNTMESEQADVEKLEGRTMAAFFAALIGKKEEKLQKERAEAYAAKARYESLCYELESVNNSLNNIRKELSSLSGCEIRYERLYSERLSRVKLSNSPESERIFELEREISDAKSRKKEISEALHEGRRALDLADDALNYMDAARKWNRFDMFGGDSMFTTFEKHSYLDSAQSAVEYLQAQLARFRSELADVRISADMDVRMDDFTRFADYFFDGFFVDMAVADLIEDGIYRINHTRNEISGAMYKLEDMLKSAERRESSAKARIKEIVESLKM